MTRIKVLDKQTGITVFVLLVVLILCGSAYLLQDLNNVGARRSADPQTTAVALARAKDALIGYALTYAETHPHCSDLVVNRRYAPRISAECDLLWYSIIPGDDSETGL